MDKEQQNLLTEAKLVMLRRMPYYGTFVIGTDMIEDKNIPTACTDMKSIRINPDWLLRGGDSDDAKPLRDREEVVFVLGHEVLHMTFKHGIRMGFRDPGLWNIAADYAINWILHEGEVGKMPEAEIDPDTGKKGPRLLDEKYKGMSAETIYDLLEKERQKQGGGSKIKLNGVVIDLSKQDPGGMGGFEKPTNADGSGLTDAQRSSLERDLDGKTSSAAAAAKSQGKLPAGLERFIQQALKPEVDWKERLRMFVARHVPSDYTWRKPNRRHLHADLYLYSQEKTGCGQIAVFCDTSGSVDYNTPGGEGAQFAGEIRAIHEDVMPEKLHLLWVDAEVAGQDVFEPGEEITFKPKGGGGTDFRPPFREVEKQGLEIQCAIYLTDMYGSFPENAPPYPVLWVATSDVVAPFGETIRIMKDRQ
jgi:predicted metal-dependent peptidase